MGIWRLRAGIGFVRGGCAHFRVAEGERAVQFVLAEKGRLGGGVF